MSDLTINATNPNPVGGLNGTGPVNPVAPPAPKPSTDASVPADIVSDSVTLSGAVQAPSSDAGSEPAPLSDSDAQNQAASLRQKLGSVSLSGTARQNQAIVALLR